MRKYISILLLWFISTGDVFPTSGTIANRVGGVNNWTNPGNITADDNALTSVSSTSQSHYVIASGFGFSIPLGATINSVTVKVEALDGFNSSHQLFAQLQDNNGAVVGATKWVTPIGNSLVVYTYTVDGWSAGLTPAIVNDPDFGVRFWIQVLHDVSIDYTTIAIEYSNRRIFNVQ